MAHYTTRAAQKIRDRLLEKLGSKCELCPEDDPTKLQFDHKFGRDYNPNKLSYLMRLQRYEREAAEGKIRLLCEPCNLRERKRHENGSYCRTEHDPGVKTAALPAVEENPY